ncbi:MAG: zinc ribbon domain-containing protein [Deltaproteobacteria bacterium]|nr:zinc ribbon domain-containing protein [Deltaproteobacteria bacterium]
MPIYEFRCRDCNEVFELLQLGASQDDEAKCPTCGKQNFERVLSVTNHAVGGKSGGASSGVSKQERTCSQGECTTWTVPGTS